MVLLLGDVGYRRLKFRFRYGARVRPVALVPAVRLHRGQGCTDNPKQRPSRLQCRYARASFAQKSPANRDLSVTI